MSPPSNKIKIKWFTDTNLFQGLSLVERIIHGVPNTLGHFNFSFAFPTFHEIKKKKKIKIKNEDSVNLQKMHETIWPVYNDFSHLFYQFLATLARIVVVVPQTMHVKKVTVCFPLVKQRLIHFHLNAELKPCWKFGDRKHGVEMTPFKLNDSASKSPWILIGCRNMSKRWQQFFSLKLATAGRSPL